MALYGYIDHLVRLIEVRIPNLDNISQVDDDVIRSIRLEMYIYMLDNGRPMDYVNHHMKHVDDCVNFLLALKRGEVCVRNTSIIFRKPGDPDDSGAGGGSSCCRMI
jgi:hypothetical protein